MQHDTTTLGPFDQAVCGALERLALQHADAARLAHAAGDLAHRKAERAAATAFTNALIQYRAGVRPEVLPSGARLIPSSTPGKAAHLLTIDGDWVCTCAAGANMHWPIALCIGIEVAMDDMDRFDGGDSEESEPLPAPAIPHAAEAGAWLQLQQRLAATAAALDAMRAAQQRVELPAPAKPLRVRLVEARKKSPYFASAFYLSAA